MRVYFGDGTDVSISINVFTTTNFFITTNSLVGVVNASQPVTSLNSPSLA
jgi:hypothetical protein